MHLIIVRRGHEEKFHFLHETFSHHQVRIIWDRRFGDRRKVAGAVAVDKRQGERRRPLPSTWANLDFLVAPVAAEQAAR